MNPPESFFGGGYDGSSNKPSPRKELQGPRPTALKVNKDSYKIRKPPVAPPSQLSRPEAPPQPPAEDRKPVIIYAVSPKVIHTTVSDFMNLVQRLTGNASADGTSTPSAGGAGDLSPAARLASIEKASPSKQREIAPSSTTNCDFGNDFDIVGDFLGNTGVEIGGRVSGILSPAPTSLPPISAGFFSPAADPFSMGYNNMFIPSPSTLFTAPMVSPSPSSSSSDFFINPFFDF